MSIEPFECFAITAPGLERITELELKALGEQTRIEDGGVAWAADARSLMRANLWLRSASRVLVRVARFNATAFFELEKRAKRIDWERFVAPGVEVEFRVTARKSKLFHSDAIAERLQRAVRSRLPVAPLDKNEQGKQLFVVRAFRDEFLISADTSGDLLHMRGYRQATGKAPVRETLAAALLLAADWNRSPLLDPFCGSGTIPIEGALLARRVAPGLSRGFAFMGWPDYDPHLWGDLTADARAHALASSPVPIVASDRDAGAIAAARANAERAGVERDIEFAAVAVSTIRPPAGTGIVATNPPYGVRVGNRSQLLDLYARLGRVLRQRCPGWRVALYSAEPRLLAEMHMELSELFRTSNGGIKIAAVAGRVAAIP